MHLGGLFPTIPASSYQTTPLFLANARSALFIIADQIKPTNIWLPDFYCPSMLSALPNAKFYHVDLNVHLPKLLPTDMIVFIDYFGWPCKQNMEEIEAWTVADLSQALFNTSTADFIVYSPRKFLPVPDGGILVSKYELTCKLTEQFHWCKNLLAMDYRAQHEEDNETWYKMSLEAKEDAPIGYYAMSQYTRDSAFDSTTITNRYRTNYVILLEYLLEYALFPFLPEEVVPIGFPIVIDNRDVVQQKLFSHNIFPPIHWKVDHFLSDKIMTLPCDYRYDTDDMELMASYIVG